MTDSVENEQLLDVDVTVQLEVDPGQLGALDVERLPAFTEAVLTAEGQQGVWEVALVFVSDDRLRELHRDFMDIDEVTDVMTFPVAAEPQWFGGPDAPAISGGDVVMSVDRAAEQGPEHGVTLEDELVFLVVHGLLHLSGWDDHTPEQRTDMLRRGQELMDQYWRTRD